MPPVDRQGEVEAVARALYREAPDIYDTPSLEASPDRSVYLQAAEAAIATLDAVRCAQGRDTDALALLRAAHGEAVTHELHGKIGRFLAAQARGRDTDAPERSPQTEVEAILRSVYTDEEGTVSSRRDVNEAIRECLQILAARSPQGEDHEAYDCPHAEVCQTCPCSHEDDACFPGERLRAERDYWRNIAQTVAPAHPVVAIPTDTLEAISARAEQAEAVAERWKSQHERCVAHMTHDRQRMRKAEAEADRLRAGISFVRGLCTDRASYSVIDERLGELLDGETK